MRELRAQFGAHAQLPMPSIRHGQGVYQSVPQDLRFAAFNAFLGEIGRCVRRDVTGSYALCHIMAIVK